MVVKAADILGQLDLAEATWIACPTNISALDILPEADPDTLVADFDDKRDFMPPILTREEETATIHRELKRIVEEAECAPALREELAAILERQRAAFGMQLHRVERAGEPVHIRHTGVPAHQPRRPIKNPRVRDAQLQWEEAMLERGVIGEYKGDASLAWPVNLVPVIRGGKIRFTADMRTHNIVTATDPFPVPGPMEALDRMRKQFWFSTTDETDAFFQRWVDDESRTPFYSATGGIREFLVMTQGGKNSPAALHRAKTAQYADFDPDQLAFLFDDVLLASGGKLGSVEAQRQHLELINRFLANCVKHGTILKATKVKLFHRKVKHQGFIIGHGHYEKDPEAIRPLVEMRMPTKASELKSQLAMLGRYRDFVPAYSQLAAPLEAITEARWQADTFTAAHQERLLEMRRHIAQATLLTEPDWNRPFVWRIDAAPTFGWAGVMGQVDDNGRFWPIRFAAKKATEADRKRWPTEMEALAQYSFLVENLWLLSTNQRQGKIS